MNGMHPSLAQTQGSPDQNSELSRRVDSGAWAAFFIWVGVTMLAQVPWGWFLVGVGVLILGAQAARWQMGLDIDAFGVACGAIFLAGGVWELAALPWSLAPVLLILLGGYLLRKAIWR
ncbi:MAG: hypothetical protein ACXWBU_16890 [Usitatibacter sp.]